jgi:hypothetical protein
MLKQYYLNYREVSYNMLGTHSETDDSESVTLDDSDESPGDEESETNGTITLLYINKFTIDRHV